MNRAPHSAVDGLKTAAKPRLNKCLTINFIYLKSQT